MNENALTLTPSSVEGRLRNKSLRVQVLREVSSTNDVLKEQAAAGAAEGAVVIAQSQTAGRGRGGSSFFSPPGTGLYMSALLRPRPTCVISNITPAAAVATAQAIECVTGKPAQIKWVNDILVEGKKVCGILAEASPIGENGAPAYCVLGLGVNLEPPEGGFPGELGDVAGAVLEPGRASAGVVGRLAAEILDRFWELYAHLEAPYLFQEYKKRFFLQDRAVTVIQDGGARAAVVTGLERNFDIRVRFEGGEEVCVHSGEVRLRVLDEKGSH